MNLTGILWLTLSTSALDSLNPIAIAQQFMLQSMTEKKRNIIAFIAGTGIMNFTAGILVYYGLAAIFKIWLSALIRQYHHVLYFLAMAVGVICFALGLWFIYRQWIQKVKKADAKVAVKKPLSLSVKSLFFMGVLFCFFELSSALPYFAYLTFFVQLELSVYAVLGLLLVYNLIYCLPLIILLVLSTLLKDKLDVIYFWFQKIISAILKVAPPIVMLVLGVVFTYSAHLI